MTSLKRYPLVVFFVLAYLFPWLVWGTSIAEANGSLSFHIPQTLAFWSLMLATFLAAALTGGRTAVLDLIYRILRVRVSPLWYAVALLLTAVVGLVAVGLHLALGAQNHIGEQLNGVGFFIFLLMEIGIMILTEETAWRGFALPRLQKRYSALVSSLILGVLWGLWHIPLFLIPGSSQQSYPALGFFALILAISVLFTWIYNHTRGSVLVAGIFHGAFDATFVFLGFGTGDTQLFWLLVLVAWLFAALVIWRQGAAHLSQQPDLSETVYPVSPDHVS